MRRAALALALAACSTIGDPGSFADELPHGGTGRFRLLDGEELGVFDGRAIALRNQAVEASMVAGGHLFYASATLIDEPPPVPDDHPRSEVFWPAFGPRSIARGEALEGRGFRAGPAVLTAAEPWEGEEVFDPWALVLEDGRTLLYYAAAGGIGVAEAARADEGFVRIGGGPALGVDAALSGTPRRPSVVRGPDGALWMYYDAGGAIGIARSEDGIDFARIDADPSTPEPDPIRFSGQDDGDSIEVSVGHPGAAAVRTSIGRTLVRLYFESRRADGTILAYVAGSEDGVTFERHELPVADVSDVRFPAPLIVDTRVTLLYVNMAFAAGGYQTRSVRAAVSPAGVRFDPPE